MFLDDSEHLIIMDEYVHQLTADELRMLADVGVRTIYFQAGIKWDEMQQTAKSPIDYSRLDAYMNRIEQAGLRACVSYLNSFPAWLPDQFYFSREKTGIPNYAYAPMGHLLDELALSTISRYPPEHFQLCYGMPADGEFPCEFWPTSKTLPFETRILADWVIARHRVLEAQHGEVWTCFHCYTEPIWFDEFYASLTAAYPNSRHYGIAYTHFIHNRRCQIERLAKQRDVYGMKYFAGSEYVTGYQWSLPMLVNERVWGFITCPIHSFQAPRNQRLEPWMLDEIGRVIRELERVYA